ncbi:glucose-6-phosphate isomerase [Sulfurimonas autotrophica]|uniref:Glucose-6-phosphate isomerase n=1 Tax=Sulfurimonas autotrophica (strain ATCC BAA-671 / DSM 16294 / JCM 11897 / OK10) TaxID=563040 RepID=E0UP65_SULAO|nr:glucose-6-phosphate isomerase [Sulfurimonas autotrophica]ADN08529.1 glucose-6-phosphate isomerase [Sulfurimonas autotrophica DSM 16294]
MIEFDNDFTWESDKSIDEMMQEAYQKILLEKENGVSGYFTLGEDSLEIMEDALAYAASNEFIKKSDTIVIIGIGGSSLGTKAIDSIFKHQNTDVKKMLFLENPDEIDLSEKLASIEKEKTLFIIVSKSGSTIETISIFKEIIERFSLDFADGDKSRVTTITDEDSVLHKFSKYYGIESFLIPSNVGGRFSVLSAVGVVPLAIAGYDMKSILEGASIMAERFFTKKENHILKKAVFLTKHKKETPMNVVFSYANCLEDFTKWYVQLWGESLGKIDKQGNHTGLTPIGHIGSVDQHSFLQLIMQGPRDKTVTFIKVDNFEKDIKVPDITLKFIEKTDYINGYSFNELIDGECEATKESIVKEGINVDAVTLDVLNEKNIGKLIMYYELLTSLCGIMLGVNTYDQPGVEIGKQILLKKFTKSS